MSQDSSFNQIRCYYHNLALTVKARLEVIGLGDHCLIPSGKRLCLLLPDDHSLASNILIADGTVVDVDGESLSDCYRDSEEDAQQDAGKVVEASDDSEDEEKAPDYKIQNPYSSLLP